MLLQAPGRPWGILFPLGGTPLRRFFFDGVWQTNLDAGTRSADDGGSSARLLIFYPSVGSGDILFKRCHRFHRKIVTDTIDSLRRGQQAGGLDNSPLAMNPVRFDGIQPRALHWQAAGEETHTALP